MTHRSNDNQFNDLAAAIAAAVAVDALRQRLAAARLGPMLPEEAGPIAEDWRTLPRLSVQTKGGAS